MHDQLQTQHEWQSPLKRHALQDEHPDPLADKDDQIAVVPDVCRRSFAHHPMCVQPPPPPAPPPPKSTKTTKSTIGLYVGVGGGIGILVLLRAAGSSSPCTSAAESVVNDVCVKMLCGGARHADCTQCSAPHLRSWFLVRCILVLL